MAKRRDPYHSRDPQEAPRRLASEVNSTFEPYVYSVHPPKTFCFLLGHESTVMTRKAISDQIPAEREKGRKAGVTV